MSFVFRGTRAYGFPGFIAEPHPVLLHAARLLNNNSWGFLVTVLFVFVILNSHQTSPNFLLWLLVGVFLATTCLRMYVTCHQQLQSQARANAAISSDLLGQIELRLDMPPSIAFTTSGPLQGLRLQFAHLDRELDDQDYDTLRALDSDNTTTLMSEEEINAFTCSQVQSSSTGKRWLII